MNDRTLPPTFRQMTLAIVRHEQARANAIEGKIPLLAIHLAGEQWVEAFEANVARYVESEAWRSKKADSLPCGCGPVKCQTCVNVRTFSALPDNQANPNEPKSGNGILKPERFGSSPAQRKTKRGEPSPSLGNCTRSWKAKGP